MTVQSYDFSVSAGTHSQNNLSQVVALKAEGTRISAVIESCQRSLSLGQQHELLDRPRRPADQKPLSVKVSAQQQATLAQL
jgi:hypothetical protein